MYKLEYDLIMDGRYYISKQSDKGVEPIAIFYDVTLARRFVEQLNKEEKKNG